MEDRLMYSLHKTDGQTNMSQYISNDERPLRLINTHQQPIDNHHVHCNLLVFLNAFSCCTFSYFASNKMVDRWLATREDWVLS